MANYDLLKKYAKVVVEVGANVQKEQVVFVNSSTETRELARFIVEASYNAGAKEVTVNWGDDYVGRLNYKGMSVEDLEVVPQWQIDKLQAFVDVGGCVISITSPIPGLNKDVDPTKMQKAGIARSKKFGFYRDHMMGNHSQWTVVAAPNAVWAQEVFPGLDEEDAVEKLWDAILTASHVTLDNDPVKEWEVHNETLLKHNKILNDFQFETLYFKNALGTDLTVKLVNDHVWAGGGEDTSKGVYFNPNIPTEENFTMPHKFGVNGFVYSTKPLVYQGNLIKDFWLEFKDGKVINFDAKEQKETLQSLLEYDDGSSYLGEVALISNDSPISNSGILFLNTLFDENASCHLALGRAYPMNVKGGTTMTPEQLAAVGSNQSMAHSDFMFGSADMQIVGTMKDGKEVVIFKDGDFVI